MSERKVLNKYIPPNFDPNKIPKGLGGPKPKQHTVRLMAPFSMRCNTCGEFIYKGRKFNARKETVEEEMYLTIKIYRFYVRCPQCGAEITFKTDPKNADYVSEHGAKRNFEPWREEEQVTEAMKIKRQLEEENNPLKALENKAIDSKREIDIAEGLDEIRTVNARLEHADTDTLLATLQKLNEDEDTKNDDEREREKEKKKTKMSVEEEEIENELIKESFSIKVKEEDEVAKLLRSTVKLGNNNVIKSDGNSSRTSLFKMKNNLLGILAKKKPQ